MDELITLNQLKEYDAEKTNKIDARFNEIHNNFNVVNLVATNATITDLNVTNIAINGVTGTNGLVLGIDNENNLNWLTVSTPSIDFDNTPTAGSTNAVTSEGILNYVDTQVTAAITQVLNTGF